MSGSMHVAAQGLGTGSYGASGSRAAEQARTRADPSVTQQDRRTLLAETIESAIVPHLLAGYRGNAESTPKDQDSLVLAPKAQDAMDLAMLSIGEDDAACRQAVVDAVVARGLERVCLELLAPAARHLGELWVEDLCGFTDVTIGVMRLQAALQHVGPPETTAPAPSSRRTMLLAPAPGEQHLFGLTMVAGFLRRAGWEVTLLQDGSADAIEAALRRRWFSVLGLSAGGSVKRQALSRAMPRLRGASRNPELAIMVGGPVFLAEPDLAGKIGADGMAEDGPRAVSLAETLLASQRARHVWPPAGAAEA